MTSSTRSVGYAPNADLDLIMRAYVYSARAHAGQMRRSGEPYLIHPIAVAGILAEMRMDVDTIAVGLLHDTMEDCLATGNELSTQFGPDVAELVDGVTKIQNWSSAIKKKLKPKTFENSSRDGSRCPSHFGQVGRPFAQHANNGAHAPRPAASDLAGNA